MSHYLKFRQSRVSARLLLQYGVTMRIAEYARSGRTVRRARLVNGLLTMGVFALIAVSGQAEERMNTTTTVRTEIATFAGGCFWCMQPPFDALPGVVSTTVGYTGGTTDHPTYEEVCSGTTGHAESIQIVYNPAIVGYDKLLDVFWRQINPTTPNRQFSDVGTQYRSAIFYHTDEQKHLAERSKAALQHSGRFKEPIVTEIVPAVKFYPAEEYHQQYYKKNSIQYKLYRIGSGRDGYLKRVWGSSSH